MASLIPPVLEVPRSIYTAVSKTWEGPSIKTVYHSLLQAPSSFCSMDSTDIGKQGNCKGLESKPLKENGSQAPQVKQWYVEHPLDKDTGSG